MNWARILAYVTDTVDQELLAQIEYLAAENRILRTAVSRPGRRSRGALAVAARAQGTTTASGERFRVRRTSQTAARLPFARGGRGPFPAADRPFSHSRSVPLRSTHPGAPSRSGPRANADAGGRVRIRSGCPSTRAKADHCPAAAYRPSPDQRAEYRPPDTSR